MIKVILYNKTPGLIPRLIRLIQGNKSIHCALMLYENVDFVNSQLIEIRELHKSQIVTLKDTLHRSETITIASCAGHLDVPSILANLIGKKYSLLNIANAAINHFIGAFKKDYVYKERFNVLDKYTCSSLVATILKDYAVCGAKINKNVNLVEPDDFTVAPWQLVEVQTSSLE